MKICFRFGMTEEEWDHKIKDCIKFLRSNEGVGQIDLTNLSELNLYGSQVTLKLA